MVGIKAGLILFCLIAGVFCKSMPKECELLKYNIETNGRGYLNSEEGKKEFTKCLIAYNRLYRRGKRDFDYNSHDFGVKNDFPANEFI